MTGVEHARALWRGGEPLTIGMTALPTPAQSCLVRAVTGPEGSLESELAKWRSLVDLNGPIDGGSYRLIPTVFHRMQAAGLDDPNRGMFKGVYRQSVVDSARLFDAIVPVLAGLDAAGITPWLSKGAGLVSAGYYPTPAARPMSDVDIVVRSTQRNKAISVLKSIGFTPTLTDYEMSAVHAAAFTNESGVELDLHWHHLHHARSADADDVITRGSQLVELGGVPVLVPGPAGLLIVAAIHGLSSNAEPPVRWLVDAAMILDRDGERVAWNDIVEFAARFRMARRIGGALTLLAEVTGYVAPESTMAALAALPTRPVERLERRVSTASWNSIGGALAQLFAGYAGSDRELRHIATRFPRYLAQKWNVEHRLQLFAVAGRKLRNRLRPEHREPHRAF